MAQTDFQFKLDAKRGPVVVIDLHDGYPEECTRRNLIDVLAYVTKRAGLNTDMEARKKVIDLYSSALIFLDNQIAVEQSL